MTLGKKLSNFRKLAGLTQQQLAEHLNLSAQAVSKWENDLSEPDLKTLKELATLYNTSVDSLLDINNEKESGQTMDPESIVNSVISKLGEQVKAEAMPMPIGYCTGCGIAVTEENLGVKEPKMLCKSCKNKKDLAERERKADAARRAENARREAEAKKSAQNRAMCDHRKKSLIWATVAAIPLLIFIIVGVASDIKSADAWRGALVGLAIDYCIFSLVFTMFYDTFIKDVILGMMGTSIRWAGLIFTFDLDEIIWLIGMKVLFAVLGFLIGLLCAALGIALGLLLSAVGFPIILIRYNYKIRNGIYENPALY